MKLVPMPDSYDLDRGLLLAVQAIQVRTAISRAINEACVFCMFMAHDPIGTLFNLIDV